MERGEVRACIKLFETLTYLLPSGLQDTHRFGRCGRLQKAREEDGDQALQELRLVEQVSIRRLQAIAAREPQMLRCSRLSIAHTEYKDEMNLTIVMANCWILS